MLKGLEDIELETYLDENLRIISLFKIYIIEAASEYAPTNTQQSTRSIPGRDGNLAKGYRIGFGGD